MDGAVTSFDQFRLPDMIWERMQNILPKYRKSRKGGRPRKDLRRVADAIFYRMRTGCQWKAIPPSLCPGSTAFSYFKQWVDKGVFAKLWKLALEEYDELVGLDWRWQSVDGAMTKAPLGGESTGKNPTDRGKKGVKRSLMTDADGIPVGLAVDGANVHDIRLLQLTIEDCFRRLGFEQAGSGEHLCLDKGYDSTAIRELVETAYGYISHIRSRGEEKRALKQTSREKPRRWVVERTHGWLNRFRAILVRWEKRVENHIAVLHLACAYFTLRRLMVFG
jgi:putative transposase